MSALGALWARFLAASLAMKVVMLLALVSLIAGGVWSFGRGPAAHRDLVGDVTRAWFMCMECRDGQLDSVLALADQQHGLTSHALSAVLLHGPGAASIADRVGSLRRAHYRMSAYLAAHPDPSVHLEPAGSYVATRLALYDRLWRVRASVALGQVFARQPLDSAAAFALDSACADMTLRDTLVLREVIRARMIRDTLSVPCRIRARLLTVAFWSWP